MPRIAVLDKSKCINGKGCSFICGSACPVNRTGKECIVLSENKPLINEELCIGCNICVIKCPAECIDIINLPEELKEPIHRFGENGFALYRIPIPKPGNVIGILGRNGIGKTTAINILAGNLMPNLGREASYDEIIQFFKGTEAQKYFKDLKDNKIKVAYKPQKVDDIPKVFKGKVMDLLKKVDEKNMLKEVAEELEIDKILNNNISTLSGGELQRVAIAATVLKDANVYYFDEPTSYLDIKQRLNVARFIRNLIDSKTTILVVEHDLIILDYLTDLIHLMYGRAASYGIVSHPLASKNGINSYIEGYLKSENIRFRDKTIKFFARAPAKTKAAKVLTTWPGFSKTLDSFKLKADEGSINEKDVIGVLGPNAIGKTTFVKVMAGILNPDERKIDLKLNVSYKPQYLESESSALVSMVLAKAVQKYKIELRNLELESLLHKKMNELSGGELQRVSIALCLSEDADLYLLDEPSAFLDVEQRLNVSKAINDIMQLKEKSALVVDHDILFVDYLSNKLLVFEGEPAVKGFAHKPETMEIGMNKLLKDLAITVRRDKETNRPRINKPGSVKDAEQKRSGKYYYS